MALIAMTTHDVVDFFSTADPDVTVRQVPRDPEDPAMGSREERVIGPHASRFRIRPLDVFLNGYIYDNASSLTGRQGQEEIGIHTRMNQTNIDAVRFGLAALPDDWRDKHGKLIGYSTKRERVNGREYDVVVDDVVNSLGLQLIAEMAQKIKDISEVTADEEKNSGGGSSPSD